MPKTIVIVEPFDGYPDGDKPGSKRVSYAADAEVAVHNAFADLVIGKGLAREKPDGGKPAAPPVQKPAADAGGSKETVK